MTVKCDTNNNEVAPTDVSVIRVSARHGTHTPYLPVPVTERQRDVVCTLCCLCHIGNWAMKESVLSVSCTMTGVMSASPVILGHAEFKRLSWTVLDVVIVR